MTFLWVISNKSNIPIVLYTKYIITVCCAYLVIIVQGAYTHVECGLYCILQYACQCHTHDMYNLWNL